MVLAAWCYYSDKEADQNGQALEIRDAMRRELHLAASATTNNPLAFIEQENLFGNLAKQDGFTKVYIPLLQELYKGKAVKEMMLSMV